MLQLQKDVKDEHMEPGKKTRESDAEMLGDQMGGFRRRLWAIVSSSLCLLHQRGGNKWLECHLRKQFNNSFVYRAGQQGLLWRAGHRWSSEWKRYTHLRLCTHTHKRPVLETGSSPGCTPYAAVADILLSGPMLRNAHKHICLCTYRKSSYFIIVPLSHSKGPFLHTDMQLCLYGLWR